MPNHARTKCRLRLPSSLVWEARRLGGLNRVKSFRTRLAGSYYITEKFFFHVLLSINYRVLQGFSALRKIIIYQGHLRQSSENVRRRSDGDRTIFGNLRKMVGNFRKIVQTYFKNLFFYSQACWRRVASHGLSVVLGTVQPELP